MIRIILCRPEYQINLGMISRAMQNFDTTELYLVAPVAKIGFEAIMFSKHSRTIIENAKICKTLKEALDGTQTSIGTSGALEKYDNIFKNCISLKEAVEKTSAIAKNPKETLALVFGAEGNGLNEDEFKHCDIIATIPTSAQNPSLNLSHSVSIALYEFFTAKIGKRKYYEPAPRDRIERIEEMFAEMIENEDRIFKKDKVKMSLKRILERALPEKYEIQSLLLAFSKILKNQKKQQNKPKSSEK